MKIIGIEGQNSVGKTTLFNRLTLRENIAGVIELTSIVPNALKFPTNETEAIANERIIYQIESSRIEIAQNVIEKKLSDHVLLDRTIISTIIIAMANAKIYGWNNVEYLLDNLIASHQSFLPSLIIHLKAEFSTINKRNLTRQNQLSEGWKSERFQRLQSALYYRIYTYLEENGLCQIKHINANAQPEEIYENAIICLENHQPANTANTEKPFYTWLKNGQIDV
jgi:thymidylate kinase